MTRTHLLAGLVSLALMAAAPPAAAAPVDFTECFFAPVETAEGFAPAAAAEPEVADEDLAELAGLGDAPLAVLTEQTLTALNSGNAVIGANVGSGAISIDQNAFSGFDGIGNFVINSGHNNTLQSSLSVSIVITQ
jgi:hypothetical protein